MSKKLTAMRNGKKKGFTLIELIVVIAILVILAAIAVPTYTGLKRDSAEQVGISNARTAYTAYKAVEAIGDDPTAANVTAMLGSDMTGTVTIVTIGEDTAAVEGVQWVGEVGGYTVTATYDAVNGGNATVG